MKKRILGLAVLSAFITLGAGYFIPLHREYSITVKLYKHPEEVWTIINAVHEYPVWWPKAYAAELTEDSEGNEMWLIKMDNKKWSVRILEYDRPHKLIRTVPDNNLDNATWTFLLYPSIEGTRLIITEKASFQNALENLGRKIFGEPTRLEDFAAHLKKVSNAAITL